MKSAEEPDRTTVPQLASILRAATTGISQPTAQATDASAASSEPIRPRLRSGRVMHRSNHGMETRWVRRAERAPDLAILPQRASVYPSSAAAIRSSSPPAMQSKSSSPTFLMSQSLNPSPPPIDARVCSSSTVICPPSTASSCVSSMVCLMGVKWWWLCFPAALLAQEGVGVFRAHQRVDELGQRVSNGVSDHACKSFAPARVISPRHGHHLILRQLGDAERCRRLHVNLHVWFNGV